MPTAKHAEPDPSASEHAVGENGRRRALVLAGGGMRVAWQAGVVQALTERGLRFDHGDGTSGGIFTLGMLMSGVTPAELGARWRSLNVRRFVSAAPLRSYARSPTSWPAFGGSRGIRDHVLPHLGVDIDAIRRCRSMTGTFNVARFDTKECVAIPHDQIDLDRLVAGVSLPILMPAFCDDAGVTWTDAVWIKDANPMAAVERGCTEIWIAWCIGDSARWGSGALEQYVHMIELSAVGALRADLRQIAAVNARRLAGEEVLGSTEPVVVHVVRPRIPLPLDPDFVAGRITAETLVDMGYRDACDYLADMSPAGVDLGGQPTRTPTPDRGARLSLRLRGVTGDGRRDLTTASLTVEITDLAEFRSHNPGRASVVGSIHRPSWGRVQVCDGALTLTATPRGRQVDLDCRVVVAGEPRTVRLRAHAGTRRLEWRWSEARFWDWQVAEGHLSLDPSADSSGEFTERAERSLHLSTMDLVRLVTTFEPTGAHSLGDRAWALRTALHAVRRGPSPRSAGRGD